MTELPQEIDVLVVGAGPAGCACARALAQAGREVLLIDQVTTGEKLAQHLSATALSHLQNSSLLPWLERSAPETANTHYMAWGSSVENQDRALSNGWNLDRRRFDTCLRAAAIEAGVKFVPARLQQMMRIGQVWHCLLHVGNGKGKPENLRARWLVDASGRRAICTQRIGIRRIYEEPLMALYASGPSPFEARSIVEAVPFGWWHSTVLPGERRFAALYVESSEATHILQQPQLWREKLLATQHIAQLCQVDGSWSAPHATEAGSSRLEVACGKGWIAAGDAALSFDPLLTQGICTALQTGSRAAQALLDYSSQQENSWQDYAQYLQTLYQQQRQDLLQLYRAEQRWSEQAFWKRRHQTA